MEAEIKKEKAMVEAISAIVTQAAASIATQALQQAAPKAQAADVNTGIEIKMHNSSFTLINDLADDSLPVPLIRAEMNDINTQIRVYGKSVRYDAFILAPFAFILLTNLG